MSKRATNLTLSSTVRAFAEKLQTKLGYGSLSTLVEDLIREEYERRGGKISVTDAIHEPGTEYHTGREKSPPNRHANTSTHKASGATEPSSSLVTAGKKIEGILSGNPEGKSNDPE